MQLSTFASQYTLARGLAPNTVAQMRDTLRVYTRFVGAEQEVSELSAEKINRFADYLALRVSPRTVKARVGNMRTLALAALESGELPSLGRIRRVQVPQQVVRAFTQEDLRRLLQAASGLRRRYPCGVRKKDWWKALLLLTWDTGLRIGDVLRLEFSHLRPNLTVALTEQKTKKAIVCRVRSDTWLAVTGIRQPQRKLILPWAARRESFYRAFRRLAAKAGVEGTSKFIRRGGATQMWKMHGPTAAARYLNHRDITGTLASKHYVDRTQLTDDLPLPPPIGPT